MLVVLLAYGATGGELRTQRRTVSCTGQWIGRTRTARTSFLDMELVMSENQAEAVLGQQRSRHGSGREGEPTGAWRIRGL